MSDNSQQVYAHAAGREAADRTAPTLKERLMIVMPKWLAAPAIKLVRLACRRPTRRLVAARMQQRQLSDIGLMGINAQSVHLHFTNAEAQLGMIR